MAETGAIEPLIGHPGILEPLIGHPGIISDLIGRDDDPGHRDLVAVPRSDKFLL